MSKSFDINKIGEKVEPGEPGQPKGAPTPPAPGDPTPSELCHIEATRAALRYPKPMPLSRRTFLGAGPAVLAAQPANRLSRRDLVSRHNPTLPALDPRSPLSVGNGEFAFTADPTGLQTFPQPYESQMPLCTQSQWGWHTAPNTTGKTAADLKLEDFDTFGRKVGYPTSSAGQRPIFDWLRENPHRLHLGRIGFVLSNPSNVRFAPQTLDLWTGVIRSEFTCQGAKIVVETCCHPSQDAIAVRIQGRLPVLFEFPYASSAMNAADNAHPGAHRTTQTAATPTSLSLDRTLDSDTYAVTLAWPLPPPSRPMAPTASSSPPPAAASPSPAPSPAPAVLNSTARTPPSSPPPNTGKPSGTPARPSNSPPPTLAPANSSAASYFPNTRPPSNAPAPFRPKRPASPATAGMASSTSKCTTGTPPTSPRGAAPHCLNAASPGTTPSSPARKTKPNSRATPEPAGPK